MKKKLLITALMMFSLSLSSHAQISDTELSYKADNRNIAVISGKTSFGENTKITAAIFADGKYYTDITAEKDALDVSSILADVHTVFADENGKWSFEWENLTSGDYDLYITENKVENPKIDLFVAAGMREKYAGLVTASEQELGTLFGDEITFKSFYTEDDERNLVTDTSKVGAALYSIRSGLISAGDIEGYLDTALLMASLNEKGTKDSLDSVLNNLSEKQLSEDWYSVYNKSSDNIKSKIAADIASVSTGKTIKEFNDLLKEKLILKGVLYSANWTDAQMYLELLSNPHYEMYKQDAAIAVVGNEYNDITALNNALLQVAINRPVIISPSGGGGGGGSSGRGSSAVAVIEPVETKKEETEVVENIIFNDVPSSHWAYDCINYLRWNDIVDGDDNGDFRPEDNITRAEFVKILCGALKLTSVSSVSFNDVKPDSWYNMYVQNAAGNGIVMGDNEGNFNPDALITRQDLAVMIHRAAVNLGAELINEKSFNDSLTVDDYAQNAVSHLAGAGIISGDGVNFNPHNQATRAEASAIIYRVMKLAGKL
ncbi:MAG: S-layer homology domain-containing protein [Clostridia bacterium]|nr:S-layer homology domain-containing protein [Clostridia bacterium]